MGSAEAVKKKSKKRRKTKRSIKRNCTGESQSTPTPLESLYKPKINHKHLKYITDRQVCLYIALQDKFLPKHTREGLSKVEKVEIAKETLLESFGKDKFFQTFVKWQKHSKLKTMMESSEIYYNLFV